ncbi:G5 domain-containing protein [Bacillus infantis]|uniref:G5 domain-containing protein n=1 Tax=Bacillus infantis TaxID=324767 RepID=UPI0013EC887F|nr:G5 domain-containing protein [Bacillus infantis]
MKNQQGVKLFLVLIACTFFIYGFSRFGEMAVESLQTRNLFSSGTAIASVDLGGSTESGAMEAADKQVTSWLESAELLMVYKEKTVPFDLSLIEFSVEQSIQQVEDGQQNFLFADIDNDSLTDFLLNISPALQPVEIDLQRLKSDLLLYAKNLNPGIHTINLESYLLNQADGSGLINSVAIGLPEGVKVQPESFKAEVLPESNFSLLEFLDAREEGQPLNALLYSAIGTGVYEAVLPANFAIIERHIGEKLPQYAKPGFEAKVDPGKNEDLVIANPNKTSYFLEVVIEPSKVTVSLEGESFLNKYIVNTADQESFKPRVIKQYNPLLGPDEVKIKQEGKNGKLIRVIREVYDEKGELLEREAISEDFYPPVHRIEVYGLEDLAKDEEPLLETEDSQDAAEDDSEADSVTDDGQEPGGTSKSDGSPEDSKKADDKENPSADQEGGSSESEEDSLWGKPNEEPK